MKAQPSLKDLPAHERPREKLIEKGPHALSDKELLAILHGKGTRKYDVFALSEKLIAIIDQKGVRANVFSLLSLREIYEKIETEKYH
jgi:DNA repair protein RadC